MMLKKVVQLRQLGTKLVSTNPAKRAAEAVSVEGSKRDNYYQGLLHLTENDEKPPGWDEALPFSEIPGPKPLPVIGNLWRYIPGIGGFYGVPVIKLYKSFRDKYGDIVVLRGIPGRGPLVMLFNVNDMEQVFRNAEPFPIRKGLDSLLHYRSVTKKDVFKGVGGLLTLQGKQWFDFRSIVNPILMQPRTAQLYINKMDTVASELVENMRYFSSKGDKNEMPEDFIKELYKWALESIGVVALDRHLGCLNLNAPKDSETHKLISYINELLVLLYELDILPPIWKYIDTSSWKRFVQSQNFITETLLKYIEESMHSTTSESNPDNLSVLQRLVKLDKTVAVTMVMDMLMAGVDTTGKSLGAALYFLARNPDKQQCLREEALKNLPAKDSPVTKGVLAKSPYVKAVIKESTRIAPIAIGNGRTSLKNMVIRGYQIPKNTDITTLNILTANSSEFKDPDKFIPERWLRCTEDDLSYKNAHPFAYLPFGFGSRSCIGKRLANLELEIALIKIVRNFQLSWNREDMEFGGIFFYGIEKPLKLTVKPL